MPRETDPTFHVPSLVMAVLAAGAACAVSLVAVALIHTGKFPGISLGLLVSAAYFVVGVVIAAVFGLPMLLILRSLGLANGWTTLIVGSVLGLAAGWVAAVGEEKMFDIVAWLIAGTVSAPVARSVWQRSQRRYATKQLSREGSGNFMEK